MSATRNLILLLTFITGFTGLVYEVTWHRYLSNLLGSQAEASAIILAVFLGGLSVGYALFGSVSRKFSGHILVQICGLLEVGIGFWGVLFPEIYHYIWSMGGIAQVGFSRDILIAAALVGPPTILMGGTLPLLTQGLSHNVAESAVLHSRIYATNTAGAFVGALSGGFFLIPTFGLALTVLGMGATNVIAGVFILLLSRSLKVASNCTPEESETFSTIPSSSVMPPSAELPLWRALIVAFIAGLVSITLQTIFIRLTGISVGSSEYSFTMVVGVFIAMLALGAWITAKLPNNYTLYTNSQLLFVGAILAYLSGDCWPYANHVIRVLFTNTIPSFYVFYLITFIAIAIVLAVPVGAMGSTMPLLFRSVRRTSGNLGKAVGVLYCVNTAGCVVGALIGGYASLAYFDLDQVFLICILFIVLSNVLTVGLEARSKVEIVRRILASTAMILLVFIVSPWDRTRLSFGTFRFTTARSTSFEGPSAFYRHFSTADRIVAYKDDPNTSVAVAEYPIAEMDQKKEGATHSLSLNVNGKSDGSNIGSDLRTTRLVGHIPALLSSFESPKVAVIGFGLGSTVGSLTLYPEVTSIEVIEISQAVHQFSELFNSKNHSASGNQKVHWKMGDAYRVLGASTDKYSIIVSEPSNPWVAGVERLYAEEFYKIVKAKLTHGGLYAQWFHTYSISDKTFGLILNTFGSAFRHVRVFSFGSDLLLIGSPDPIDVNSAKRLESRLARPAIRDDLEPFDLSTPEQVLALESWFDPKQFEDYGLHTLEFPKLAFAAGKDFFLQASVNLDNLLSNPDWASLVREKGRASLASELLGVPMAVEVARRFGASACGVTPIKFFAGWEKASRPCRSILGYLLTVGVADLGSGLLESDQLLLKYLAKGEGASLDSETKNLQLAQRAINLFRYFDSPLFELSTDNLKHALEACYQDQSSAALECRATARETLEGLGREAADF